MKEGGPASAKDQVASSRSARYAVTNVEDDHESGPAVENRRAPCKKQKMGPQHAPQLAGLSLCHVLLHADQERTPWRSDSRAVRTLMPAGLRSRAADSALGRTMLSHSVSTAATPLGQLGSRQQSPPGLFTTKPSSTKVPLALGHPRVTSETRPLQITCGNVRRQVDPVGGTPRVNGLSCVDL